jgi:hypothetical protein
MGKSHPIPHHGLLAPTPGPPPYSFPLLLSLPIPPFAVLPIMLERLYLLERVDKHGALAPLTVREALGVVAVRADEPDDETVCPLDYLDLADADIQPLRRCAVACSTAYHAQCTTAWHAQLAAKEGKALSCPVCLCTWMDALVVGAREHAGVTYTTITHSLGAAT